ncbi:4Fe-4S binding protein, partial [Candidatus Bathyarchaeota archaeon]|nr:4Fe-4S binding protein [Candidatus Bathyarchaeota archaeon]
KKPVSYVIDEDVCSGCKLCLSGYGCPALMWNDETMKASIDTTLCMGCDSCAQVCPTKAIHRSDA